MNQRILYSILLVLFSHMAFGQFYAGVNNATLTTKGTESTTELSTTQMVGRYIPGQNKLTLMVKTQTFSFDADQQGQSYLNDVLLVQSNPLMALSFDLDLSGLSGKSTREVNGLLLFNDQELPIKTQLQVEQTGNSLIFSANLNLDLSKIGIYTTKENQSFASIIAQLTIDQATLQQR
ncbi:MAG: hypothetical protein R3B93_16770 [Bacteroidia bacterium]